MTEITYKIPAILDDISNTLVKILPDDPLEICGGADRQGVYFYPEEWKNYFCDDGEILSDLNAILKTINECEGSDLCCEKETIRRRHVFKMASKVKNINDAKFEELRRVFLASMIWGYGTRHGFGLPQVRQMTADFKLLSDAIRISYDEVKGGCIESAYNVFSRSKPVPYLREPFFTKYLYFIGRDCELRPLILDGFVTKELECDREGKIVWDLLTDYANERTEKRAEMNKFRYVAYVKGVDGCVKMLKEKSLNIIPDDIEIFLWKRRGKDPQP